MPDIGKLQSDARALLGLLSDPHPGIASWQVGVRAVWLRIGAEAWGPEVDGKKHAALLAAAREACRGLPMLYFADDKTARDSPAVAALRAAVDDADRLAAEARAQVDARFQADADAQHANKPMPRRPTYHEAIAQRDALVAAARRVLRDCGLGVPNVEPGTAVPPAAAAALALYDAVAVCDDPVAAAKAAWPEKARARAAAFRSLCRDDPATTPEPPPKPAEGDVWNDVIADMKARRAEGIRRYGTPLQAHNGRRPLVDAYQEALDLVVYMKQALIEKEG